jgi:hypothetical protein
LGWPPQPLSSVFRMPLKHDTWRVRMPDPQLKEHLVHSPDIHSRWVTDETILNDD